MAVYHGMEELCYGPELGLPEIARVFYCIRHKLLRDGLGQKPISYQFISEKTGMTKRNIVSCINKLKKLGLVLIIQNKEELGNGKVRYYENTYMLNPEKFGDLYNWYKNNPTVRVYEGDKIGSYSRAGIAPFEENTLVSDKTPGVVSDKTPGVVSDKTLPNGLNMSELLGNLLPNNPKEKNPKEKIRKIPRSYVVRGEGKTEKIGESFTQKEWNRELTEEEVQKLKEQKLREYGEYLKRVGLA